VAFRQNGESDDDRTVALSHVAAILFTLGIFGIFLNRKNVIVILMSVELMLLCGKPQSRRLLLVSWRPGRQVFALIVLTVAAAEAAIGLALIVVYFRNRHTIDVAEIDLLKG
jgi:NADH-quinone oxidoreductase subunit K